MSDSKNLPTMKVDATELLGGVIRIRETFFNFQQYLFATA